MEGSFDTKGFEHEGRSNTSCVPSAYSRSVKISIIVCRIAFLLVFALNVTCAIQFIATPNSFVSGYMLEGRGATAAIQGIGVSFLMWNCTYPLFIAFPQRNLRFGIIVLIQQLVGLIGEGMILTTLGPESDVLASSIMRFIAFDLGGLLIMLLSYIFLIAALRLGRRS